MMKKKKIITIVISVLAVFLLAGLIFGLSIYNKINSSAFEEKQDKILVYIDNKKDYKELLEQLHTNKLKDEAFFNNLAGYMKYPENIKSGRYIVDADISYLNLVRLLRSGKQTPVKLTFNNVRLKEQLVERIGEQLMFEPDSLLSRLTNPIVAESFGFDTVTFVSMFIPNTYEIYWDTSVDSFLKRMKTEYDKFWNEDRKAKAKNIGLSPEEVSVLSSIVEEETANIKEYPIVAGLYINRLHKGILLQADPTVKFAVGDVTLNRILYKHLEVDSPYNTYKYFGLPPGPIRIPSIQGIDAVLNYKKHNYLYMCAKEDFSGTHNFATTLSEHNRNARKYQDALNRAGIR